MVFDGGYGLTHDGPVRRAWFGRPTRRQIIRRQPVGLVPAASLGRAGSVSWRVAQSEESAKRCKVCHARERRPRRNKRAPGCVQAAVAWWSGVQCATRKPSGLSQSQVRKACETRHGSAVSSNLRALSLQHAFTVCSPSAACGERIRR